MLVPIAFLLSGAASGVEPSRAPWVVVTKDPAAVRQKTTMAFGTLGVARSGPFELAYYAKRTTSRGEKPRVEWADSISCPALRAVLGALRDVSPPRIDVPGFPPVKGGLNENIVIDGISYTLKLDRLSFSANVGTGLANWTENALIALEPCWHSRVPSDVNPTDAP